MSLRRMDPKLMHSVSQGEAHWYTDGGTNEVYLVTDAEGLLNFHISFMGNYVEGGRSQRTRCGHVLEEQADCFKRSNLIELFPSTSAQMLTYARQLVQCIEQMPANQKAQIENAL